MIKSLTPCALALAALAMLTLLQAAAALAASKVWVSNRGLDGASCGAVTTPCATFQQAHNNVAAGGEVGVLTAGDYGPLTIGKSVHITNDGTGEANIRIADEVAQGILVQTSAGDVVSLRGLVIDGEAVTNTGIEIFHGSAVHIQNCVIRNFNNPGGGVGILLQSLNNTQLFVSDTIVFNNGTGGNRDGGIVIRLGSAGVSARVELDRVHLENNVFGIQVDGSQANGAGIHVTVRDSVVSGNAGNGIWSLRPVGGGSATVVVVDRTQVVNNAGAGVLADGGGIVLLGDSMAAANGTGASVVNGGRLFTYGNNVIDNNAGEDLSPAAIARTTK